MFCFFFGGGGGRGGDKELGIFDIFCCKGYCILSESEFFPIGYDVTMADDTL